MITIPTTAVQAAVDPGESPSNKRWWDGPHPHCNDGRHCITPSVMITIPTTTRTDRVPSNSTVPTRCPPERNVPRRLRYSRSDLLRSLRKLVSTPCRPTMSTPNRSRHNIFQKYFNLGVGSKYYDGGFEDKMTRREAALILGVRESSTHKRIKEAHRKLLILNHPDTGGSTYLSGKLNEAKDLLLKGRKRPVQ